MYVILMYVTDAFLKTFAQSIWLDSLIINAYKVIWDPQVYNSSLIWTIIIQTCYIYYSNMKYLNVVMPLNHIFPAACRYFFCTSPNESPHRLDCPGCGLA